MIAPDFVTSLPPDPKLSRLIQEAGGAENAALRLMDKVAVSFYWIGGLVYVLHRMNAHLRAGYPDSPKGFVTYMCDVYGLSRRKTYVLPRIYRVFCEAGLGPAELKGLGWRKAEVLTRLPTEELTRGVLERARHTRLAILEKEIKSPESQDPRMIRRREKIARKAAQEPEMVLEAEEDVELNGPEDGTKQIFDGSLAEVGELRDMFVEFVII